MSKRLRCKRCKELVITSVHPELGEHASCKCNSELWAEFDDSLWETEEVNATTKG